MPDASLSLFISYSRTDSALVDRLEADLKARNFYVWVDRRKIEAGQNFRDELQKAIDRCQIVLVILSPEAMESKYVRQEYGYADEQNKTIIPLNWRATKVPLTLNGIQWVDFQSNYDQGLADLLIFLSRQEITALPPAKPRPSTSIHISEPVPVLVTPQPAPALPDADLNELYRAGVAARAQGDLERTAIFWQQVLDRNSSFGNGTLSPQMKPLMTELHPIRVRNYRQQAEQAHRSGVWGQEIGAWQGLLGLEPKDKQAKERLSVAQQNQQYAWMYENAQEFATAKNIPALKEQLRLLWQHAPYYGDPAGLAKQADLQVPLNFQEAKDAQSRAQAAEDEAKRQAERTLARQRRPKEFVAFLNGPNAHSTFIVICAFCLLIGVGASVGALTRSWQWAVGVSVALGLLSYAFGYHRAWKVWTIALIIIVGVGAVFGITWFYSTYQYDQQQTSQLWFNALRILTLRHQIIFGVILGAILGFIAYFISLFDDEGSVGELYRDDFALTLGIVIVFPIGWLIATTLGSIFYWGFGFGYGWAFTLLAAFLALAGTLGLKITYTICRIALTTSSDEVHRRVEERKR